MGYRIIFYILLSLSNAWACPEGSGRVWVEPEKSIPMEACLDMDKEEFKVWKLGEVVYQSSLKEEKDLKKIQSELKRNKKLKSFPEISKLLSEKYAREKELQAQMLSHSLSILSHLNTENTKTNPLLPCDAGLGNAFVEPMLYQDLKCHMTRPQKLGLNQGDYIVKLGSPLASTRGLLSDGLTEMMIEIYDRKNNLVNNGTCEIDYQNLIEDKKDPSMKDSTPEEKAMEPSFAIGLTEDISLPLDFSITDTKKEDRDPKKRDQEAMDFHLGVGVEKRFYVQNVQRFTVTGGMEMPVMKGVQGLDDAMSRDRLELNPNEVQLKFQIKMSF